MKTEAKFFVAGLLLVVCATLAITAAAQTSATRLSWNLRVNETRGPIRAADVSSPLGNQVTSEILGGPTNGSDAAYFIFTRMPPGARGPALFTLPDGVAHLYLVLSGKMNVQIGTDQFVVEPKMGVVIPPGVPHHVWNADAQLEARVLETIAPMPSRDLMSMLRPAQPRKIENAAQYIRRPRPLPDPLEPGLNGQRLAGQEQGDTLPVHMRIDNTRPGQGGPPPHVHKFTQVYFSIEGATNVLFGLDWQKLPTNSIYIVPPGTVHTNKNEYSEIDRHIVWIVPEPQRRSSPEEPWDVEVEFKGGVGTTR